MNNQPEVVCVGIGGIDITASTVRGDVFDRMVSFVDSITTCAGGDALNEAMTLGKLGHAVSYMGCSGHDAMGMLMKLCGEKCGVDMSSVRLLEDINTQTVISLVGENDKRNFLFKKDCATNHMDLSCIDWDKLQHAKVLSFGSLSSSNGFDGKQLEKLFRFAKEHGAIVCVDVAIAGEEKDLVENIASAFPYVDYIFPNAEEAAALSGEKAPDRIADFFLKLGVKNVVMKLGGDGCFVKGEAGQYQLPAFRVKAVNTTGAGDNFLAGFISGLLQGLSMRERLLFATATAALTVMCEGASDGVKNMQQVRAFLEEHS